MGSLRNSSHPHARPVNVIISGSSYWNPGDDFVRDGIIAILREVLEGRDLNFLFFDFESYGRDPGSPFRPVSNTLSPEDVEPIAVHVDAIVVAGLSVGSAVKDFYSWIIENELESRTFLIGAGYDSDYAEEHARQEPEATIFRNARAITGRTSVSPTFFAEAGLDYHHINCPSILSVPEVKQVRPGKPVERIAFSIQLPTGDGLVNQTCEPSMHDLAVEVLSELSSEYAVDLVAHHKMEYLHFLNELPRLAVPADVHFSSFYRDLFDLYPAYDLVITTRLHSALFANGFGIPAIVLNNSGRHTYCLDGFPHSVWTDSRQGFAEGFERVCKSDLGAVAEEAKAFKRRLLRRYVDVLREPFTQISEG